MSNACGIETPENNILNGEDLKTLGVAQGPAIKETLQRLLEARLDGEASSRGDEESLVRNWLAGKGT